ncbi:MAG: type II toxin-antitoxin system HicB family antitoxin [Syntrophales bacterium]|nr:type II toxin-antitoxin system HicB family antitoxin [Syntrophales bacterium]MDY0044423.1 type II toxin-antitoxin system HicB family antitoxin [Syntrophales bacterium]
MNFNTATVAQITGLSKRRIGYMDSTDLIKPSVQEAAGYGSTRLYSFIDLVQLMVAKNLLQKVSMQKIRKAVQYLKKAMPDIQKPLANLRFLTDGETIFVITEDSQKILDVLKSGQFVMTVVALGEIVEELKGKVESISSERRYDVKVKGLKYSVILHRDTEDGGYWVECPDLPGCASQGDTVEEALSMIKDAIQGFTATKNEAEAVKSAL